MHASLAYLPSPSDGVWHLGRIPIRAYALCIIAGIVLAVLIGRRRWAARGGRPETVSDIAVWAVIFGVVGGRLYHVLTDPELYFGTGRHPVDALRIWQGGLGIWGAITLGGVGAWIGCRRRGIKLPPFADAAAPGIAVAQAVGRWGNWFNQELFGRPTTLPWGLKIDPGRPSTVPGAQAYQPTFLYESLWDLLLAGALVWVDRRFTLGRGRVFALYVMGYTAGRVWIEALRIDTANHILGLRLNIWTSIIVFAGALIYFLRHPGPRETEVEPLAAAAEPEAGAGAAETASVAGTEAADAEAAAEGEAAAETEAAETEAAKTEAAETKATADAGADAEPVAAEPAADAEPTADAAPTAQTPAAQTEAVAPAAAGTDPGDGEPVAPAESGTPAETAESAASEPPSAPETAADAETAAEASEEGSKAEPGAPPNTTGAAASAAEPFAGGAPEPGSDLEHPTGEPAPDRSTDPIAEAPPAAPGRDGSGPSSRPGADRPIAGGGADHPTGVGSTRGDES